MQDAKMKQNYRSTPRLETEPETELVHSIVNKGSGAWPADSGVPCDFFPLLFRAILGLPGFGGSARRVKVRKKKMMKMMKKSKRMWLECTVLGNIWEKIHIC